MFFCVGSVYHSIRKTGAPFSSFFWQVTILRFFWGAWKVSQILRLSTSIGSLIFFNHISKGGEYTPHAACAWSCSAVPALPDSSWSGWFHPCMLGKWSRLQSSVIQFNTPRCRFQSLSEKPCLRLNPAQLADFRNHRWTVDFSGKVQTKAMLMATPLGDGVVHSALRPAEVSNVSQVIL